jgi:flagellar biosynthesis protein FliR
MISITSAQLDLWIGMYLWPFVRLLALFMTAPLFQDQAVPARAKIGFSLLCAMLVAPLLPPEQYIPVSHPNTVLLLAQQILIGAAIGFSMRLVFTALELAGDLIGLQMGLSFAGFISPGTGDQTPLVGSFLGVVAALIFLAVNGHLMLIAGVVDSFNTLPIDPALGSSPDFKALAHAGADVFRLGLHIALPVLATMLILNLALGVLARVAPQLNIFAIGFPVTLLIGMIALAMALPFLGPVFEQMMLQGFRPLR